MTQRREILPNGMYINQGPFRAENRPVQQRRPRSAGRAPAQFAGGALDVVLQTHLVDQAELLLDEIDVLFLALLDVHQKFAGDVVLHGLAMGDGPDVHRVGLHLAPQIALQDFAYILADEQLAEIL